MALRAAVDLLLDEGLDNVFARHYRLAEGVRQAVSAWGLKLCAKDPKWHSDTVSAILHSRGLRFAPLSCAMPTRATICRSAWA